MLLREWSDREFSILEIHQEFVKAVCRRTREIIRQIVAEISTGCKTRKRIAGYRILIAPVSVIQWEYQILLTAVKLENTTERRFINTSQFLRRNGHRIIPSTLCGVPYDKQFAGGWQCHPGGYLVRGSPDTKGVGNPALVVVSV